MARTLVGRLQLVVEALGLEKGKKVESTLQGIERAAQRLSRAPWGTSFQRQLEKVARGAKDIDQVRIAWDRLNNDMTRRGLTAALKKSEVSAWKTATIGHFAAIRSEMQSTEHRAREHVKTLRKVMLPLLYAGGAYSFGFAGAMAGQAAFRAASEGQRTKYRFQMAGIGKADTEMLDAESTRLAGKYGVISKNDILELGKTSYALFGGRSDLAKQVLEAVVQNFVADFVSSGEEYAGNNMSAFLKAMDNLNKNEGADGGVGNIAAILNGWTKAKQVEGKDIEIGEILSFAQRAKVAKYALDNNFLSNVLPGLGQDMGFGPLGDALSGAYANLVTPNGKGAGAVYLNRQREAGLRDQNDSLIQRDRFAANPYEWTIGVLKPLLHKNGIDTDNPAATAEAVKKLMSNSKAAAAIVGWISSQPQIDKNVANYQNAAGLSDAANVRAKDPFAAWRDVKSSLEDLANAAGETVMPVIVPALNSLANTIRAFAGAVQAGDPKVMGTAGILGAGVAAYGGWKVTAGLWALVTAGPALNEAAAALTAAAVAQGGSGVVAGGAGAAAGGWGIGALFRKSLPVAGVAAIAAAAVKFIQDTSAANAKESKAPPLKYYPQGADQDRDNYHRLYGGIQFEGGMHRVGLGAAPAPNGGAIPNMLDGMDRLNATTAAPKVDPSSVDAAVAKVRELLGLLGQIGVASSAAARRADNNIEAEMRRAHTGYGIVP